MHVEPFENTRYRADRPWRMLLRLYWPERRWLGIGEIMLLFKSSPVWVMPLVTANIIDLIAGRRQGGMGSLWLNAGIGAVFILQNVPSSYFFVKYTSLAIRRVENRLRSTLVHRLQMLSIAYYDKISTGKLQTKLLRDVESIEQLSRQLTEPAVSAAMSILVALGVTAWRMPTFVPVLFLLVPVVAVIRYLMSERLRRFNEKFRREIETMTSQVLGMINMIPVTRAHAAEKEEIGRAEERFGRVREAAQRLDSHAGLFNAITWVTFMIFNLVCLTTAAVLTYRHMLALTPGDVLLLTGYFTQVVNAVQQLNYMLPVVTRGFDAMRSIGEVLECPDIEENHGKHKITGVRGEFRFENVGFRFGGGDEGRSALRAINLVVATGETIGIVGPSGSGKSTFLSLLIGFHRPTSGRMLLDGVPINEIDLRTYRRHLAVVSQQTILFEGTLRENIVYGAGSVSEGRLREALEAANSTDFIEDLPDGLETDIGEDGARLSGGQRQRIAIARAMLRDPRILILDEATSALDSVSEERVQQALERLMVGRTTFIVAHRVHTLRQADRILTLENGTIVGERQPAELTAQLLQAATG